MKERRKFPRLETDKAKIIWRKEGTFDNLDSSRNISGGGICLETGQEGIQKEDLLSLNIALPGEKLIDCKARVAWVVEIEKEDGPKYLFAVEFIDISAEDREKIKQLVEKSSSK